MEIANICKNTDMEQQIYNPLSPMYNQTRRMPKIMLSSVCPVNSLMLTPVASMEDSPTDPLIVHQSMRNQNSTVSTVVRQFELDHHSLVRDAMRRYDRVEPRSTSACIHHE